MSLLDLIRKHQVIGVVDSFFGDSGKGKVVDWLAYQKYNDLRIFAAVYRPNGGPNTGHSVYVNGTKQVFHLIPSAALIPDMKCFIGRGVAFDPPVFYNELNSVNKANPQHHICVDADAHVIMPWHIALDNLKEAVKGNGKIGTTGKGVGPCMATKCNRDYFVTIGILADKDALDKKVSEAIIDLDPYFESLMYRFNSNISAVSETKGIAMDYLAKINLANGIKLSDFFKVNGKLNRDMIIETYYSYGTKLKERTWDTLSLLQEKITEKKRILVEGTQGALLDKEFGTYPYVTAGSTTRFGLEHDAGMPLDLCINVVKAYGTRVGSGPFPTEINEVDLAEKLRKAGNEYGSTTGRPRRVGWLDAVALRYALKQNTRKEFHLDMNDENVVRALRTIHTENDINRLVKLKDEKSYIALMKMDVLEGFEPKICDEYLVGEELTKNYLPHKINNAKVGHCEILGTMENIREVNTFDQLPPNALAYIKTIEKLSGSEVVIVGKGPNRNEMITK